MQNLSSMTKGPVPGSSMSASNTVTDRTASMVAPGSESEASHAEPSYTVDPFSHAIGHSPSVLVGDGPHGDGNWAQPGGFDEGSADSAGWKQT